MLLRDVFGQFALTFNVCARVCENSYVLGLKQSPKIHRQIKGFTEIVLNENHC